MRSLLRLAGVAVFAIVGLWVTFQVVQIVIGVVSVIVSAIISLLVLGLILGLAYLAVTALT